MRGERGVAEDFDPEQDGSSPHARGTRHELNAKILECRFIPACAGNATAGTRPATNRPVHPRMRGERARTCAPLAACRGSSPHARGTRKFFALDFDKNRFIPACAGNAGGTGARWAAVPVHPRMRGERDAEAALMVRSVGSSPHARGTHLLPDGRRCGHRFIPACAGNARAARMRLRPMAVHPRMRGERCVGVGFVPINDGSSPHARGTLHHLAVCLPGVRFIPACAGNARGAPRQSAPGAVHPRMRGERLRPHIRAGPAVGSSPHARGTRNSAVFVFGDSRFIPACAGNAFRRVPAVGRDTVHPRMRGERQRWVINCVRASGSSPHARGTPGDALFQFLDCRFIPACAGNASAWVPCRWLQTVHPRMRGERTSNKLLIYRRKSEPSDSTKHSGC